MEFALYFQILGTILTYTVLVFQLTTSGESFDSLDKNITEICNYMQNTTRETL